MLLGSSRDTVSGLIESNRAYRDALDRHGFVLTVKTDSQNTGFAADVMEKAGAENIAIFHGTATSSVV